MAIKCEEEFNPWPSFVDIFSSVILVLLLFLLVTIVNIGYYSQFKYKIRYTGSIATDKLILHDTTKTIKIKEKEKQIVDASLLRTTDMQEKTTQAIQEYLTQATQIDSAGEDLADVDKKEEETTLSVIKEELVFYVKFAGNQIFIDQTTMPELKSFVLTAQKKYPDLSFRISTYDPTNQVSATITKQISLGRAIGVKNLIGKFKIPKKSVRITLNNKVKLPEAVVSDYGVIIVEIVPKGKK